MLSNWLTFKLAKLYKLAQDLAPAPASLLYRKVAHRYSSGSKF